MTQTITKDTLQKFIFDNAAVKGELVEISSTWREVQARHDYPPAVKTVLGEMLAAAALLVTLPVLLVTVLAQRQIVAGLSAGGLKDV